MAISRQFGRWGAAEAFIHGRGRANLPKWGVGNRPELMYEPRRRRFSSVGRAQLS